MNNRGSVRRMDNRGRVRRTDKKMVNQHQSPKKMISQWLMAMTLMQKILQRKRTLSGKF